MEILFVGIGGALGSVTRYQLGKHIASKQKTSFPLGTFIVNISGAVLLGLVAGIGPARNASLLLADGFLGAYTTFSAFMYEGFSMFKGSKKKNAFAYIAITMVLGVAGFMVGFALSGVFV